VFRQVFFVSLCGFLVIKTGANGCRDVSSHHVVDIVDVFVVLVVYHV
jgi:hypothetical protein